MKTNNYPSWLVPIDVAKKLKEIGFNEPCLVENVETHSEDYNFINFKEEMYSEAIVLLEDVEFVSNKDLKDKLGIYKNFVLRTAIPTWEQVFEWFRKKGLHSHIEVFYTNIKYDKKSPKIFNECKTEILEKPITLYNYFTGHKSNGTFMFGISNNTITLHTKNYKSYEECRETMVNSLIKLYKNESSI